MGDFIELVGRHAGPNELRCMIKSLRRKLADALHLLDLFFGLYRHDRSDRKPAIIARSAGPVVPLKTKNPNVTVGAFR